VDEPLATSSASILPAAGAAIPESSSVASTPPAPRPLPLQDQHTLSQLKRGNWSAMEELVHRYQDRLFSAVLRMVGHPEDAADLVQETFVRAMQNVSKFEGKSSLYTWLFRIAINLALSHRRSQRYRTAASLDGPVRGAGGGVDQQADSLRRELVQGTELDPAAQAEIHIEHERAVAALSRLDPEFRAIIVLRDVEDCDYDQIGEILDLPVGTVKSRLFRARAALRDAFAAGEKNSNHNPPRSAAM
jgi:RNA polymerase sigma-70 factor, ECF subfamily